ncbi:MAG: ferrous iron transport protein B [Chitinophagaceae bacterium]|nr:ferrous iron transport protein B [Chitinophagaceae bacterium]MBK8309550.1 ferrous iron transport protein B [Chitinophagaceae bacterium]MBK8606368.1 ferrous iron transport protein B [Chitinophagaceae bacterium]MBP7107807.1 ferrous iron transport protein B [Chitinophagaceae bacterium]HQV54026.1 ferrous iron transport protein B [Chitinophagaceae bacterium]
MKKERLHIALVGNPNSGKSSLFNCLTGLNQQVGNFPGVTVDKKTGTTVLSTSLKAEVIDLPGTYSLYPKRMDEWVSYKVLLNQDNEIKADVVVVVADASNLKRNLLFCTQIIDLKVPVVIALTMMDMAKRKGIKIDTDALERELGVPVVPVSPRKNKGIDGLKKAIEQTAQNLYKSPARDFVNNKSLAPAAIEDIQNAFPSLSDYTAIHYLINHESFDLPKNEQETIEKVEEKNNFNPTKTQAEEILMRYGRIKHIMQQAVSEPDPLQKKIFTERLDNLLLHRVWGYVILLAVLFLLFQCVFWIAQYPMDWIEIGFAELSGGLSSVLPDNRWTDLLINGVLAGLSGILVFVPQIMILFGLITLLEDTGYMARISFLSDRLMRSVGLNGKSVMPMISGFACAVPAIMSARNIENRKERLLTILITPLMSCSARLPVYTILIGLVIPKTYLLGFLGVQGLVMMGLYLLGLVMALIVSYVAKWFINIKERSFFILELPTYRSPRWNNLIPTMISKAKIFVFDAGKVIMVISLILWGLSSFGPGRSMQRVTERYEQLKTQPGANHAQLNKELSTAKLESSYAGILGKTIEPVITPLGYDWKIGIALITSFAAREVFVGTMATLYSVGDDDADGLVLKEKMKAAKRPDGTPVFNLASGLSLMIFYVFAMQCMSTLVIVKKETKTWKWPIIQLIYMTGLAYVMSWIVYQIFK